MRNKIKLISILILIIISTSTVSFAIYKAFTIGTQKLNFQLTISSTSVPTVYNANTPKLANGMIPITWDSVNSAWKITGSSVSDWGYDYSNKIWANAMLSDGTYTADNIGQIVPEADLGSMFVWIPRYEYMINYTDPNTVSSGGTISINYIPSTITQASATAGYTIPPAFTNGYIDSENTANNYLNGEWSSEIDGIWVAKFEASNNNGTVKIAPNKRSWQQLDIQTAYSNSLNAQYGLTSTDAALINSHLTKNSEWGAVAYLAYSQYGKEMQVNINSYFYSNTTRTGFGGNAIIENRRSIQIPLAVNLYTGSYGLAASTTGNIYGVYDMSGGTNEFIAGYFNGTTLGSNALTSAGKSKYVTEYTDGNMLTGGKNGEATKETYNWDSNGVGDSAGAQNLNATNPYMMRGGGPTNGESVGKAGLFSYFRTNGASGSYYRGFRTVLVVE